MLYFLHPSAGLALALLMATVIVVAMIHTPKAEAQPAPPEHSCVVDLDRSRITVHDDNSITATCAIAGCRRETMLGHNIANAYMVVH